MRMTLMGIGMHAIVNWKHNEQQLKVERQVAPGSVFVEQGRLYQEQLQGDVIEHRKLQNVSMELNAQLQQAK